MTDSSADRDPIERLAEEFVARYRRGERPSVTEYADRLPGRAGEVRDLFPALVEMEQLKPVTADHVAAPDPPAEPTDPARVGEFRILRRIGRGGMGVVYEAVQESLGRHVALKILPAEAMADPKRLERFRREARAAARLHHTNIVPVFGVGEADGRHYYAMQFIAGHPLDAVIDEVRRLKEKSAAVAAPGPRAVSEVAAALLTGTFARTAPPADAGEPPTAATHDSSSVAPVPSAAEPSPSPSGSISEAGRHYWGTVARIGAQVADALAYAHAQGVLHRDVKPANLLLDVRGTVWVTDFGLAKSADADDLTHAGDVVGTLRYMAPERFDGAGDHRSDVYALGLTLYELLTLRPAFAAENRAKLVQQVTAASPPSPRGVNPLIPRDLETVVLKATARDPAARYQGAAELAEDLRRFTEDRPIRARRASSAEQAWRWCRRNKAVASLIAAVLLVFAAGAATAAYFAVQAERKERDARAHAQRADDERERANHEADDVRKQQAFTRRLMYGSQMSSAAVDLAANRIGHLLQLLEDTRPRPGEPDLRGWEWHYLDNLTRTGREFPLDRGDPLKAPSSDGRNPDMIHVSDAFSADGRWLTFARRKDNGTVVDVYETATGRKVGQVPKTGVLSFPPDSREQFVPVLDNDGKHLLLHEPRNVATEGPRADIPRFWDVTRGEPIGGTLPKVVEDRILSSVVIGPDAAWVAAIADFSGPVAGPRDVTVIRWEQATGAVERTPLTVGQGRGTVSFGPDGRTVFWSPTAQTGGPGSGAAGPMGGQPDKDGVFECWDVTTRTRRWSVPVPGRMTPNTRINTDISPSGSMVLVIGPREATVHRVSDGGVHWTTDLPADMSENGIGVRFLVSDDGNRIVFKWSHTLAVVENNPGQAPVTRRFLFRERIPEGLRGLNVQTNLLLKLLPDGQTLVGFHRFSAVLRTWDVSRDPEEIGTDWRKTGRVPRGDLSPFSAVPGQATSADGRRVARSTPVSTKKLGGDASGFTPNFVRYGGPVVITEGEREVARAELPARSMVNSIQFLDSGLLLVAMFSPRDEGGPIAAGAGRWAIYDPAAGGKLAPVAEGVGDCVRIPATPYLLAGRPGFAGRLFGLHFSTQGYHVLDAATGREAYSRTPAEGEELAIDETSFHPASGRFVEVRRVHTAGEETCRLFVRVCDIATGNEVWATDLGPQPHHARAVASVTITPDGHRFVLEYGANLSLGGVPARDDTGSFWAARLADGGDLRAFRTTFPPSRSRVGGAFVRGFSPDGREVILAGDNEVQTWNLYTGELTHRLARHPALVFDVQYSPDGTRLFTTTRDNFSRSLRLHVWDTATDREVFTMPLGTRPRGLGPTTAFGISVEGPKVIVHRPGQARVLDGTPVKP